MRRRVAGGLLVAVAAALAGCGGPARPVTDEQLRRLTATRRQLEERRPEVVAVYGPDDRAVRLLDHQLRLVDEQISLRRAAVAAKARRQGD